MMGTFYWSVVAKLQLMSSTGNYRFECPECAENIEVNEPMKEAIVASGCIICGTAVTDGSFER